MFDFLTICIIFIAVITGVNLNENDPSKNDTGTAASVRELLDMDDQFSSQQMKIVSQPTSREFHLKMPCDEDTESVRWCFPKAHLVRYFTKEPGGHFCCFVCNKTMYIEQEMLAHVTHHLTRSIFMEFCLPELPVEVDCDQLDELMSSDELSCVGSFDVDVSEDANGPNESRHQDYTSDGPGQPEKASDGWTDIEDNSNRESECDVDMEERPLTRKTEKTKPKKR